MKTRFALSVIFASILCWSSSTSSLWAEDAAVLEEGKNLLPDLCAPLIYQATNGTMPSGAEKRHFRQESYEALLATMIDPSVKDGDLFTVSIERMVKADPSLSAHLKPKELTAPKLFLAFTTHPLNAKIGKIYLTFECQIRNYGTRWIAFQIMIKRKGRKSGFAVQLVSDDEKY